MASSLAKALADRPVEELRRLLDEGRASVERAHASAQRSQFEVEVIEEALSSAVTSPAVAAPPPSARSALPRPSPQEVRERVLAIVGELGRVPPKPVREAINDDSINVYNALGALVDKGELAYEDGLYGLPTASPNGSRPEGGE